MKMMMTLLLVAAPVSAQAMWMHPMSGGPAGGHFSTVLYGLLAVLGYWVLRTSVNDTPQYVKRTGQGLAWLLIAFGVLGLVCGVSMHAKKSLGCQSCEIEAWDEGDLPIEIEEEETAEEGGQRTIRVKMIKKGPGGK